MSGAFDYDEIKVHEYEKKVDVCAYGGAPIFDHYDDEDDLVESEGVLEDDKSFVDEASFALTLLPMRGMGFVDEASFALTLLPMKEMVAIPPIPFLDSKKIMVESHDIEVSWVLNDLHPREMPLVLSSKTFVPLCVDLVPGLASWRKDAFILGHARSVILMTSCAKTVISAIDGRLGLLESQDADECECALEALGQIGMMIYVIVSDYFCYIMSLLAIQGATLLLSNSPPAARHVVDAAFDRHGHGKQLAALHALGNIAGETRSESNRMLNVDGEENLRVLIYETASKSSKLTPSVYLFFFSCLSVYIVQKIDQVVAAFPQGLFLSVLQQDSEIRLAGYRLIAGLTARPWCLMEICSRQEIINIVTDAFTETTKIGMEARHNCCQAIRKALMSSPKLASDPNLAGIAAKLEEAVRRGPYLARKHSEAQPAVMTAERF
ncbi:hypothetical protein TEA_029656 [Camellia sinensis var. sinensis]|uniref:Uncharacterized protein n=1 Tax=Camellia sinensis var. sinensis TaxID=542762 RepID=A0A4S4D1T6_CAMSN|nr:hypothetical protein TEA_029656 [Camellia sinensis var. sinensis]